MGEGLHDTRALRPSQEASAVTFVGGHGSATRGRGIVRLFSWYVRVMYCNLNYTFTVFTGLFLMFEDNFHVIS